MPALDSAGNLAQLTTSGTATTLRVTSDQANYNANFYMLVPADTSVAE